jgi:filamentous hemagglutinin
LGKCQIQWRFLLCQYVFGLSDLSAHYYRIFDRYTYEPVVTQDDPGQILSGGAMTLTANTLTNQQSKIVAGGTLTATAASINNQQVSDLRRVNDVGTQYSWGVTGGHDDCWPCRWKLDYGMIPSTYNVNTFTTLTVAAGVSPQNTAQASAIKTTFVGSTAPPYRASSTAGAQSALFRAPSSISASYFIETDPRLVNYRQWLSSDYLLAALSFDPLTQQKRLGDGFYEQRLIREQVSTLTGQRFLAGYQSEEEEYRGLMDGAITVAKQFNLRPGIALTAEQVAQLTSDIVWLVEREITLPSLGGKPGEVVRALVPQVYVRLRQGDLAEDGTLLGGSLLGGSLMSGNSVSLEASGNITNGGTLMGRQLVSLTADNISNSSSIQGGTVALSAALDINNLGGSMAGKDAVLLDAGRDINVTTGIQNSTNASPDMARVATTLDRVAGLYVASPSGVLVASARLSD